MKLKQNVKSRKTSVSRIRYHVLPSINWDHKPLASVSDKRVQYFIPNSYSNYNLKFYGKLKIFYFFLVMI